MSTQFTLNRLAEFGDFIVYERGKWARRERRPRFLVSRASDGRDLEEFRRRNAAIKWAKAQAETGAMSTPAAPGLSARESAAILAALRFWQVRNLPRGVVSAQEFEAIEKIAANDGPALDAEEIDGLCLKLGGAEIDSPAGADDGKPWFRNFYKCSEVIDGKVCGAEWEDEHDCTCNDRCPKCNAETEPHHSEDAS